jgi:hypothetical protein
MEEESEIQKLKAQYPEFFKQFSDEFLNFVLSEETSSQIATICLENGIVDEEKVEEIAYRITLALFDQIPKESLVQRLVAEVGLSPETAKRVFQGVEESIFSKAPKGKLKEMPTVTKVGEVERGIKIERGKPKLTEEPKESPKTIYKDIYREPIE